MENIPNQSAQNQPTSPVSDISDNKSAVNVANANDVKPLVTKQETQQPVTDSNEKLWSAIAYVPMMALLSLLIKPDSAYVRLHGRQGLLIFLLFFVSIFLYVILVPLGPLLAGLAQLGLFVIGFYSAVQALLGNWWKIPVLGDIAENIPVDFLTKTATQVLTGQQSTTTTEQTPPTDVKPPQGGITQ